MNTTRIDHEIIHFLRKAFIPTARLALFVVYFWFGALKLAGLSPAGPIVYDLFERTIHFMSFDTFYVLFALFEMTIGIFFLFPHVIRIAIPLLVMHMITTFLPLVLLSSTTWQGFLTPTLEGQYIIKNLVIMAVAIGVASHAHPMPWRRD
jgi:uncharacterized membrane protein YkgB